jgi:hypothetical protein
VARSAAFRWQGWRHSGKGRGKTCPKCKKPFWANKNQRWCKPCIAKRMKEKSRQRAALKYRGKQSGAPS